MLETETHVHDRGVRKRADVPQLIRLSLCNLAQYSPHDLAWMSTVGIKVPEMSVAAQAMSAWGILLSTGNGMPPTRPQTRTTGKVQQRFVHTIRGKTPRKKPSQSGPPARCCFPNAALLSDFPKGEERVAPALLRPFSQTNRSYSRNIRDMHGKRNTFPRLKDLPCFLRRVNDLAFFLSCEMRATHSRACSSPVTFTNVHQS